MADANTSIVNPFPIGSRLFQIYAAHRSARPTSENPAWQNTHRDLGYVLAQLAAVTANARVGSKLAAAITEDGCCSHWKETVNVLRTIAKEAGHG